MTEQEAQAESAEEAAERRWPGRFPEKFKESWKAGFLLGWSMALSPARVVAAPSDTDRETLAGIIQDVGEYVPGSHAADYVNPYTAADAILAAGFSRPSQPVQVEVTNEMVERAAQAFGGLTTTNWSGAEEWERRAVRGSMRAALSAALGVPEEAEQRGNGR